MIGSLTLSQAAIAYGGTLLFPDCVFTEVSTDSRSLQPGQLFVALEGENFDGHQFLKEAARKACGLVVSKPDKSLTIPQWVVADTTVALGRLARLSLERFDGRLVALTGSAGKTTVKEMLAAILAHRGATLATKGNLNNHIGVPKTLFELTAEHRYAVIEMGASGPGEIDYLCRIARPDVALVTNVLPAHIAGFGSESVIAETKGAVYSNLKEGGTAVINIDDPWHQKWMLMSGKANLLTCSLINQSADIRATDIDLGTAEGSRFVLHLGKKSTPVVLPLPGRHNVANALIAAGAAFAAGAALVDIVWGLENMKPVKGRMQMRSGIAGCAVLDDSYNANPGSVKAAIDVLALKPGKRVLVLGDMAELGSLSTKSHREIGIYARDCGIEELYATGQYADHSARGFGESAKVFASKDELVAALKENLDSATTVLVKGSRSAAMDLVVARIIVEEDNASVAG